MATKGTEISTTRQTGVDTIANFPNIESIAKSFMASGMFSDTKSLAQAIVKIIAGAELGLPPVYSMQNINLIRDRLTSSANTLAMLVKKSSRYNYRIKEHDETKCSITFYERDGEKWAEVGVSTFTMEDAKRANLVKPDGGWVKFPRAMLFSRAISQGARIYAPDAIGGVYTDEEIRAIPPKPEEAKVEPETSSSMPSSTPETHATEAVKAETSANGLIDQQWLAESLPKIKWPEKTVISWLRSKANYQGLDLTGSLEDVIGRMNKEQAEFLVKEITTRMEMQ